MRSRGKLPRAAIRAPEKRIVGSRRQRAIVRIADLLGSHVARRVTPHSRLARLTRPVLNRALGGGEVPIRVVSGPAAGLCLLIESAEEKFYWSGNHERHLLAALAGLLHPGDCLWDVGAHIGYVSCFAATHLCSDGTVVAFEPVSANRLRLRGNVEANGLANVVIAPYAVAQMFGTGHLFEHQSSAMWSLQEDTGRGSIAIECITLDAAMGTYPAPAVIKIDAEGAELDVIRGGRALLAEHRPSLVIEFSDSAILAEARADLPDYSFELLGDNHWLLHPVGKA